MALPSSGTISMNDIHDLLGASSNSQCSLNDSDFRSLAGKPSGTISMGDFHGMSIAREIPSYFDQNNYSAERYTDVGQVKNKSVEYVNPSNNRRNLLITISHVDIHWNDFGHIYAKMQDGTSKDASPKPWWLGGDRPLGYWYGNGATQVGWGGSKRAYIPPIPGDYTLDIEKLIGGVRHRTDLRDSGHPDWPGWSFRRFGTWYDNTWSIWVEGQNVHSIGFVHRGTSWGGFRGVELFWQ